RDAPAIVAGDFNAPPDAEEIVWLASRGFHDLGAVLAPQPTNDRDDRDLTSPIDSSNQRIDYVFAVASGGDAARAVAARPFLATPARREDGTLWASDHNGVAVDVEIK